MDGKAIGFWAPPVVERIVKKLAREDDVSVSKLMNRLIKAEWQRRKVKTSDGADQNNQA